MPEPLDAGLDVCGRRLDPEGQGPVAVAFSGGGDSLALLLTAQAWARRYGRPLLALHVDHGLQTQSIAWADRAEAAAARLDVPFKRLLWIGKKPSTGLPAAAREARHGLIAEAARAVGAKVVLLGHTLDDQLENALMRGAGVPVGPLREWSPSPVWPQGRDLFHCRPLLAVRREALREWLRAEGLDWIDDPANADLRYARARARQAPQGAGAEPPLAADITRLAAACRVTPWGAIEIDRAALSAAPDAEAQRLLQIALACASGASGMARAARVGGLLDRLRSQETFIAGLAGARVIAGQDLRLVREAGEAARGGLEPVDLGSPAVWDGRWLAEGCQGLQILALAGHAAQLAPSDAAALVGIPASDRPSLPVLRDSRDRVRLARLAKPGHDDHLDGAGGCVRLLVERRFKAACGLIRCEAETMTIARMAKFHPSPYVGAEGKD